MDELLKKIETVAQRLEYYAEVAQGTPYASQFADAATELRQASAEAVDEAYEFWANF